MFLESMNNEENEKFNNFLNFIITYCIIENQGYF